MTNRKGTSKEQINRDTSDLAALRAEQEKLEARPTHVGFIDASKRVKLVYQAEALDESLRKQRERLADETLRP